jgi:carbon-monoxide dehydrogenase small subunit
MAQVTTFTVNGVKRSLQVDPCRRLLSVLREELALCGTKEGCGLGECGACTILMDGLPVNSCLVLVGSAQGSDIVTVEGLTGAGDWLHPVQKAFVECGAVQCGFCTPGFILAAVSFVDSREGANDDEIRAGLAGNLCRCTGYIKVVEAVQRAFELKRA